MADAKQAPAKTDEPKAELKTVTYMGLKRLEHTATGKVFYYGTKHKLTAAEWEDLYRRTAGEPFEVE